MSFVEPFADELLSSWLARVRCDQRAPGEPLLRAYRNRAGHWRHPDVNPKKSMIAELAASEGFTENSVAELGLCYRYPRITPDFVAWHHVPSDDPSRDFAPALTLRLSWCSRCLAEDYAAGRPAYIRADWAMAAWGFCFRHHWPLVDRCVSCGSSHWAIKRSSQGPPRLCCIRCRRGLERAHPRALELEPAAQPIWINIVAFEAALRGALRGKVPDQFRFNDTSAGQLLEESARICLLFARAHRRWRLRDKLLHRFAAPVLTLDNVCPNEPSCEMPLALASPSMRRCLIAICAAMLDADCDPTVRNEDEPVVDVWARMVDSIALQQFIQDRQACSPTLKRTVEAACHRNEKVERMSALRSASTAYKTLFRDTAGNAFSSRH